MLLVVGLVVLIIPTCLGVMIIFSGGSAVPEILEAPDVSFNDFEVPVGNETVVVPFSDAAMSELIEKMFPAVNLFLFFLVSVVLIFAASVLMGKGVGLIKEVKLRAVSEGASEEIKVEKTAENKEN